MDLWVVAAAAGAGYVAKNLQNLSLDKKETLIGSSYKYSYNVESRSRNLLQQLRDKTCPLRRLARKTGQEDSDVDVSEVYGLINSDKEVENGVLEDFNMGLVSRLPPVYSIKEESLDFDDVKTRNFSRINRKKFSLLRPLDRGDEKMDDNAYLYPSISTLRPVLVSDGRRAVSRSGSSSSFSEFEGCKDESRRENGVGLSVSNVILRSSSLGQLESVEGRSGSSERGFGGSFRTRGPETTLLFITGMTVGILSATTAWKTEVDKLNNQLMQMQNLVQDLHDELDMKEMLMVKDLTDEGNENATPLSIQEPIASPSGVEANNSKKIDSLNENDKYTENLELLSKIEAELQVELEMLENNMKSSALEKISSVVELYPDFDPDIVQGGLNPALVNGPSESENETTETTTNHSQPSNYAVSPWELSLRLHEVIEARLENRIKELEMSLANSRNSVQDLGSDSNESESRVSYDETEFSPYIRDEHKEPNGIMLKMTDKDQENEGTQRSTNFVFDEESESEDEGTDESEMLLIRRIVERRRSSSNFNFEIY